MYLGHINGPFQAFFFHRNNLICCFSNNSPIHITIPLDKVFGRFGLERVEMRHKPMNFLFYTASLPDMGEQDCTNCYSEI